jgi:hypothetical protein
MMAQILVKDAFKDDHLELFTELENFEVFLRKF